MPLMIRRSPVFSPAPAATACALAIAVSTLVITSTVSTTGAADLATSDRAISGESPVRLASARARRRARVAQRATPASLVSPADEGKRVVAKHGAVSSANGLASDAGLAMLKAGGNAIDAAVATAFALGVVEPQMSGLGGSGAAMVWLEREDRPVYLDFYAAQPADSWRGRTEPAPASPTSTSTSPSTSTSSPPQGAQGETPSGLTVTIGPLGPDSQPPAPGSARREPGDLRIVGIPGNVAGLLMLHEKFGKLTRAQVMAPAIALAEDGFPIGQVLAEFIVSGQPKMRPFPQAVTLYAPDGHPRAPGDTLKNPELAESLRRVMRDGRDGFYRGPTAEALIATLNQGKHPATLSDLAAYQPQWKRPLCTDYRGLTVLSAPPPLTGFQVLHTLELLEPFNLKSLGLPIRSAAAFDLITSALRVGQAAARGNGDPNWVPVPANGISSADFAARRKSLIGSRTAAKTIGSADATPFDTAAPVGACANYEPYGPMPIVAPTAAPIAPMAAEHTTDPIGERAEEETGETTHVSVVDKDGNAVSLTQTNSTVWGSGGFTSGFFLNDSGFNFTDENINAPSRSRWRIRTTTIAPTIALRRGDVQLVIGAPGAARIPTEIVQVMLYILDYDLDPLDAVKLPRIFPSAQHTRVQLEHGFTPELLRDIRAMGYDPVAESTGYARLYLITRRHDSWIAVADPRHDGQPRGY
jgi:gamma-glutamyltranspeptidase / glutathione hydrolase